MCVAGVCVAAPVDAPPDDGADAPDGGGNVVCGNLSLLRDTFDQPGEAPLWWSFADTGAMIAEANGELVLDLPAVTDAYAGYISRYFYDLHGGAVETQVDEVGAGNTILEVRNHLGNTAQLVEQGGDIYAGIFNVAGEGTLEQRPWNPAEIYWRIKEDGGDMVWEVSTDRATWDELHRRALPFPVDHVRGVLASSGEVTGGSRARFEDMNLAGTTARFCPTDDLRDDFAAAPLGPTWDPYTDAGCTIDETGGNLVMTFEGNNTNSFCGMSSLELWDLTMGDGLVVDGSSFPSATNFVSYFQAVQPANGETRIEFTVDGTNFDARSMVNSVTMGERSVTFNRVTQKFWRLKAIVGTAIFETAPAATGPWTEFTRIDVPWDLTMVEVNLGAGNYDPTTPVTISVPGINAE